jgi:hypothetical protein
MPTEEMVTRHTPGPWTEHPYTSVTKGICEANEQRPGFEHRDIVIGSDKTVIAVVQSHTLPMPYSGYPHVDNDAELEANARLIMAAPDLLAALRLCEKCLPCLRVDNWPPGFALKKEAIEAARAAIAKAEGR